MQIICIYQKYFVILHRFFGSEPETNQKVTPKSNPKNNETMKAFIETENRGFVNANFRRGQRLPETFWYDETTAQTFTLDQTETLLQLLKNNRTKVRRAVYVR